jgi:hypothetical protein
MEAADIDPSDLATRSGFSVAQIERWQAGQSIIYCSQLLVLAGFSASPLLHCSPETSGGCIDQA